MQGNVNDIKATQTTNGTSAAPPISNWLWSGRELAQLGNPGANMASAFPALVPVRMAPHCCPGGFLPPARLSLGEKQPGLQKVPWARNRPGFSPGLSGCLALHSLLNFRCLRVTICYTPRVVAQTQLTDVKVLCKLCKKCKDGGLLPGGSTLQAALDLSGLRKTRD